MKPKGISYRVTILSFIDMIYTFKVIFLLVYINLSSVNAAKIFSYPLLETEHPTTSSSFFELKSKDLKVFLIELPKTLFIISLFSNFVIEVSLMVKVDWLAVSRLATLLFLRFVYQIRSLILFLFHLKNTQRKEDPTDMILKIFFQEVYQYLLL